MSNETKDTDIVDEGEQEQAHEDEQQVETAAPQRSTMFVAWLALFASILALIVFGTDRLMGLSQVAETPADTTAIDAVSGTVGSLQTDLAAMQRDIDSLSGQLAARDDEIAAIERQFADRLRQIDSMTGRMSAVENSVTSLQGISTGARDAWLLAEAEYYMQIANAQLQLAGNPALAALALELADERILQLANPALTGVRRALAAELRSLELMDKPDTAGAALTLASLAEVVDSLPLRQEVAAPHSSGDGLDPELSGSSRALASLKSALGSAVSVRRVDEAVRPFIAPEAQYFLRANLALQLQAARLAMLRGETTLFEQSLDDAASWLNEYYDGESLPVRNAVQTIAEVRGSALSVAVPDISGSLAALRQFNALADAASRSNVESTDENNAVPEQ